MAILDPDVIPGIRGSFREPMILGARKEYQISFEPRSVDTVVDSTIEQCDENGDPVVPSAPVLDVSELQRSAADGIWYLTFYPTAVTRGNYWVEVTWTTSLGMIFKHLVRLTVI
jgi:hypothetical protein